MKEKLVNLAAVSQFKNKILELMPTKTSQLDNDIGFVTIAIQYYTAPA